MRQTLKTSMPTQLATTAVVILLAAAAAIMETLTMLAGGGSHCSHDYRAYDSVGNEDDIITLGTLAKVKGECFP